MSIRTNQYYCPYNRVVYESGEVFTLNDVFYNEKRLGLGFYREDFQHVIAKHRDIDPFIPLWQDMVEVVPSEQPGGRTIGFTSGQYVTGRRRWVCVICNYMILAPWGRPTYQTSYPCAQTIEWMKERTYEERQRRLCDEIEGRPGTGIVWQETLKALEEDMTQDGY